MTTFHAHGMCELVHETLVTITVREKNTGPLTAKACASCVT